MRIIRTAYKKDNKVYKLMIIFDLLSSCLINMCQITLSLVEEYFQLIVSAKNTHFSKNWPKTGTNKKTPANGLVSV
jgi:hypothetical protein